MSSLTAEPRHSRRAPVSPPSPTHRGASVQTLRRQGSLTRIDSGGGGGSSGPQRSAGSAMSPSRRRPAPASLRALGPPSRGVRTAGAHAPSLEAYASPSASWPPEPMFEAPLPGQWDVGSHGGWQDQPPQHEDFEYRSPPNGHEHTEASDWHTHSSNGFVDASNGYSFASDGVRYATYGEYPVDSGYWASSSGSPAIGGPADHGGGWHATPEGHYGDYHTTPYAEHPANPGHRDWQRTEPYYGDNHRDLSEYADHDNALEGHRGYVAEDGWIEATSQQGQRRPLNSYPR